MTAIIKPAPGRKVRQPDQGYSELPQEGAPVTWGPYWERALLEGDVVLVKPEKPARSKSPAGEPDAV